MRRARRTVPLLSLVALVLVAAGCSSSDPETPAPAACAESPAGPIAAEQAARCTYQGWITNNIVLLSAYAAPGATDDLPTVGDDPRMTFDGCDASAADGESVCTWSGTFANGPTELRLHVTGDDAAGYRVTGAEL
ncbi:MAG: hypothetical protein AAGC49_10475 [Brevundimonas sp.]